MMPVRSLAAAVAVLVLAAAGTWAQDAPKPGPEHDVLKQLAGEWDAKIKFTPQPGSPAQESKGVYTAKRDVGGFFLVTEFNGEMLGQPFQGRGLTGYDPHKKKYIGVWVDSMGPTMAKSEGEFDKDGKVFTEIMEGTDPSGKPMKWRGVTEIKDKDTLTMKMFTPGEDGKEIQIMDVVYTRKK